MRDFSHVRTSCFFLGRVKLGKVVPLLVRTWDFLVPDLLELHLEAFCVFFFSFQILTEHAAVPLQVWVRVHALDVVLSFFQLATSIVVLFVNRGEIDIL